MISRRKMAGRIEKIPWRGDDIRIRQTKREREREIHKVYIYLEDLQDLFSLIFANLCGVYV